MDGTLRCLIVGDESTGENFHIWVKAYYFGGCRHEAGPGGVTRTNGVGLYGG
jgi:hypothetical protein